MTLYRIMVTAVLAVDFLSRRLVLALATSLLLGSLAYASPTEAGDRKIKNHRNSADSSGGQSGSSSGLMGPIEPSLITGEKEQTITRALPKLSEEQRDKSGNGGPSSQPKLPTTPDLNKIFGDVYDLVRSAPASGKLATLLYSYVIGVGDAANRPREVSAAIMRAYDDLKSRLVLDYLKSLSSDDSAALVSEIPAVAGILEAIRQGNGAVPSLNEAWVNQLLASNFFQKNSPFAFQLNKGGGWTFLNIGPNATNPNGSVAGRDSDLYRVYVDADPSRIPELVQRLQQQEGVQNQKIIDYSNQGLSDTDRKRSETLVVYVDQAGLNAAVETVRNTLGQNVAAPGTTGPLFTQEVGPGVSVGQEPRDLSKSFSQQRADLLKDVAIHVVFDLLTQPGVPDDLRQKLVQVYELAAKQISDPAYPEDFYELMAAIDKPQGKDRDLGDVGLAISVRLGDFLRLIPKDLFTKLARDKFAEIARQMGINPNDPSRNQRP